MKLSTILNEMNVDIPFELKEEKEFRTLALVTQNLEQPICCFFDNEKFLDSLTENTNVAMVLTTKEVYPLLPKHKFGVCIVEKPRVLYFKLQNFLSTKEDYIRKESDTRIGNNCQISPLASIAKKNVVIGDNVRIEEFVVIRENTIIGDNVVIRAGVKIGGVGFEFKRLGKEGILSVEHCGGVIIENDVEIQYNSTIDRAIYPWDNTVIGAYTKIDNLVHIAHGVKIGKNVMVVANSGIGGRTIIGDDSWIGFAATIINGIEIGCNARANIGSVVTRSVPNDGSVTGNFAIEHAKFIQNLKVSIENA